MSVSESSSRLRIHIGSAGIDEFLRDEGGCGSGPVEVIDTQQSATPNGLPIGFEGPASSAWRSR